MRTTDTYVFFWGGPAIYSNWYPATCIDPITRVTFANSEQMFMWYKAHWHADVKTRDAIAAATKPDEAKALGRQVRGFNPAAWDIVKLPFMVYSDYTKFSQNPAMTKELLDTGHRVLVEASPFDKVWGVGLSVNDPLIDDPANWLGQNLLGEALMQVRDLLRQDIAGTKEPGKL